jgi:hypothetical protein
LSVVYPYPYALIYPDIASKIAALKTAQDAILKWEIANAITGLVSPSAETVIRLINSMNNSKKPSLVQNLMLEEKGVPLPNEPSLMYNYAGDEDLDQHNFIIDGVKI